MRFSAYLPVVPDPLLPATDAVQLNREHRLYQADWLLRFYGFNVSEIIDEENPFLAPDVDPKANWALNHLDSFPVEVNSAPLEALFPSVPASACAGQAHLSGTTAVHPRRGGAEKARHRL